MAQSKEELRAYQRAWRAKNRDRLRVFEKERAERRKTDSAYKNKRRDAVLKNKYGITLNEYEQMCADQNNRCKLCKQYPSNDRILHVDHCHETGRVRGALCAQCNWYMGKIDRDPDIINRIIEYKFSVPIIASSSPPSPQKSQEVDKEPEFIIDEEFERGIQEYVAAATPKVTYGSDAYVPPSDDEEFYRLTF